ncbi:hypothetical protein LJC10_03860 [Selenomonadales bacterium OttesenSCG-928-I06]|nr:hypothetical protein [Selenomonadales bacterium OttesenSCG-928-I06]
MERCPVCSDRIIGRVGVNQYYCSDCCVEFIKSSQGIKIYSVEIDGSLSLYESPIESGN